MENTQEMRMGTVEAQFADIIWLNEPLSSRELVTLCAEKLNWKKSTTYTVLKKLCDRGIFQNKDSVVTSLISKEEFESLQSRKFVEDYIDLDKELEIKDIAEAMTNVGSEYDSAEKMINATKLVIGEIKECEEHPDSDHLHVCKVDIGTEVLQIVCGAPNARKGIKVIVAREGADLPGGIKIKRGQIRGVESCGMMCSIAELGLDSKFLTDADKEGIAELGEDAIVGEDPVKYLEMDDLLQNELLLNEAVSVAKSLIDISLEKLHD